MTDTTQRDSVDPAEIVQQRKLGWPDFHPEDYCHHCGQRNICWTSPEWVELTGSDGGILCPVCFADHDSTAIWVVQRWHAPDEDQVAALTTALALVTDLGDDAERVARCVIDSGWHR